MNAVEHDPEESIRNTVLDCCSRHPEIADDLRSRGAKSIREIDPREEL